MRIMSPLFTVAIVSVVCAIEGAETSRVAAPSRAPRTCFTITSLDGVEHMPTPCNYVHTEVPALSRIRSAVATSGLQRGNEGATARATNIARWRRRLPRNPWLGFQDGACRRLVGDQPVDQAALQCRPDRRNLGGTDGCRDGQGVSGNPRWNAGQASVGPALD